MQLNISTQLSILRIECAAMYDFYLPTRCIELKGVSARSDTFSEYDEYGWSLTEIPDMESIEIQAFLEIGDVSESYGGEDFWVQIFTGDFRPMSSYDGSRETMLGHGAICLTRYSGERAIKVIEEIIVQCDEGTLSSSMGKLTRYLNYCS